MIFRKCGRVLALAVLFGACETTYAAKTGEWLFEEGAGTVANNTGTVGAAGNGSLLGTTGTPTWVPGLYNGSTSALQFNFNSGTSAYDPLLVQRVHIGTPNDFIRNAAGATLLAWVKIDAGIGQTRTFFSFDNEDVVGTPRARANLQMTGGTGQFRVLGRKGGESNSSSYVSPTSSIVAGTTYFLAGVFDYNPLAPATPDIRLYVNGVLNTGGTSTLRAEYLAAGNSTDTTNTRSAIGSNTPETGEQFLGILDGLRVYNETLTAQQILDIYNAEVVPEPATCVLAIVGGIGLVIAYRRRRANA